MVYDPIAILLIPEDVRIEPFDVTLNVTDVEVVVAANGLMFIPTTDELGMIF